MTGRAWVFGDNVDTDALAPGYAIRLPIEELARHCLESIDDDFAGAVAAGDFVVAGVNFGIGSSREQAAEALRHLGVAAVIARSFGGIFYRNAFNLGLPALVSAEAGRIAAGDVLDLDLEHGQIADRTQGATFDCEPIAPPLRQLIADGGLVAQLEKRLAAAKQETTR
ncbi:MAG: 3-isopropylmalate dehydratase [Alphaproteobacteria bacterium]|nr:MAG: 3-isopropylmalate dehydratase [Alphaproteobacteria bacterium]